MKYDIFKNIFLIMGDVNFPRPDITVGH